MPESPNSNFLGGTGIGVRPSTGGVPGEEEVTAPKVHDDNDP